MAPLTSGSSVVGCLESVYLLLIYFFTSLLPRLVLEPPWSLLAATWRSTSVMSMSRLSVLLLISGLLADSLLVLSFSLGRLRLDMARLESLMVRSCQGPGEPLFLFSFSSELTLISGHGSLTRVLVDSAGEGRLVVGLGT